MARTIPKEALLDVFRENPDVTFNQLKAHFKAGSTTIARELKRHGLRTKPWSQRKHRAESRQKIGKTRRDLGVAKGERNPNFGEKPRPWLEGDNHPLRRWHQENPDFGENQRGESNPVHRVAHLYDDRAYVERITRGLREHVDERRGSTYEEVYGDEKAEAYKQKLRDASPARMAKFKRKETAPEKIVREILEGLGVPFQAQAPIGWYTVDFLVQERLVVQANGDFWHAHPLKYGDGGGLTPLSERQRNRVRLDRACDTFLRERGYRVIRLWECDLHSRPEWCLSELQGALSK